MEVKIVKNKVIKFDKENRKVIIEDVKPVRKNKGVKNDTK